jgi:hypothetical protein
MAMVLEQAMALDAAALEIATGADGEIWSNATVERLRPKARSNAHWLGWREIKKPTEVGATRNTAAGNMELASSLMPQ